MVPSSSDGREAHSEWLRLSFYIKLLISVFIVLNGICSKYSVESLFGGNSQVAHYKVNVNIHITLVCFDASPNRGDNAVLQLCAFT